MWQGYPILEEPQILLLPIPPIIANVTPILIGKIVHLQILSNDIVGQIVIFLVYSYAGFLRWGDHQ